MSVVQIGFISMDPNQHRSMAQKKGKLVGDAFVGICHRLNFKKHAEKSVIHHAVSYDFSSKAACTSCQLQCYMNKMLLLDICGLTSGL